MRCKFLGELQEFVTLGTFALSDLIVALSSGGVMVGSSRLFAGEGGDGALRRKLSEGESEREAERLLFGEGLMLRSTLLSAAESSTTRVRAMNGCSED